MKAFANAQGWEITAEHARGLVGIFGTAAKGEIGLLLMGNRTHLTRNLKKINDNLRWLENQFVEVVCADGIIPRTSAEMLHELLKAIFQPQRHIRSSLVRLTLGNSSF